MKREFHLRRKKKNGADAEDFHRWLGEENGTMKMRMKFVDGFLPCSADSAADAVDAVAVRSEDSLSG